MASTDAPGTVRSPQNATRVRGPLNLHRWIEDNRHLLQPPVGNKTIWLGEDFIIFVSAGPNTRNDYHVNPTGEFFYQIKGDIYVKIIEDGASRNCIIREGEIFYIPSWVPHSPQRPPGTLGLVVEYVRPEGQKDALRFYCDQCSHLVYEEHWTLANIDHDLKRIMHNFWDGPVERRTCTKCGAVVQHAQEARLPAS
ncbi:MAG: 3-hydroxyanthranilate 3,4-dioxygenase [Phycisphaerales bacterium]